MTRLLLRGGEVVASSGTFPADVLIADGRIAALRRPGAGDAELEESTDEIVDVDGCFLLPGAIDTHTHLEHVVASGRTRTADDFTSGTLAAASGGTTTIVDFVRAPEGVGIHRAFLDRRARAASACVIDFSFHPIVPSTAGEDDSFEQLLRLAREEGATSWKFFMAYPGSMVGDDVMIRGFRLCRDAGVLPMVHAENGHIVADAIAGLVADGRTAEHEHLHGHPAVAEAEAVDRAASIAEHVGTDVFVVHVSAGEAAAEVARRRGGSIDVLAETCPQYLVTAYEDYSALGYAAAGYVCSPPIRERANQDRLWRAIADGDVQTIGTDHAAFTLGQPEGLPPQKPIGRGHFPAVPNGIPGVEERLMVMYEAGVVGGRISLNRLVDLTATRPAQIFGLAPRKGAIVPGADADIVVWDPAAARTLGAATQHSRSDYSVYEGMRVSGSPRRVYARGTLVAVDGAPTGDAVPGRGVYLSRSPYQPSRAATGTRKGH